MKKVLITTLLFLAIIIANAQTPSTFKFLGIPVGDKSKSEMINILRRKGFVYDYKYDCLTGEFNGVKSNIFLKEYHGRVNSIGVMDADTRSENAIRIRYNNLLEQLQKKDKYYEPGFQAEPIPATENISYETIVNKKTYDATLYYNPLDGYSEEEMTDFYRSMAEEIKAEVGEEEVAKLTEDEKQNLIINKVFDFLHDNTRWYVTLSIAEFDGEYCISLFYGDMKNFPDGEDL